MFEGRLSAWMLVDICRTVIHDIVNHYPWLCEPVNMSAFCSDGRYVWGLKPVRLTHCG